MEVLIIGGGIAALSTAKSLRKLNKEVGITLLGREGVLPYFRPSLTKVLSPQFHTDLVRQINNEEFFVKEDIRIFVDKDIVNIDFEKKIAYDSQQNSYSFDILVFATGSDCFVPPIPGSERESVYTIRELSDVKTLCSLLKEGGKNVTVIGGGVLGLEAAEGFRRFGCGISVVEVFPSLLGRQLDPEGSILVQSLFEENGVSVYTDAKTKQITDGFVELESGERLKSDITVISAGVRARTALAEGIGLETGKGIKVNEYLQTSIEDVYAVGDCAEVNGVGIGLWKVAMDQGTIAGENIAKSLKGDSSLSVFNFGLYGFSTNLFKKPIFSLGTVSDPLKEDSHLTDEEIAQKLFALKKIETEKGYEKFFYKEGKLIGAVLFGDIAKAAKIKLGSSI